ncbi:hypothetical protein pEaSNUABM18_00119 [Erwinia phage pEa_SNUABM_18]|nr:hypothetical protein pEaSNUABM18_00119 [Erwinia phage pEa_SNUABM_18]
MKESLGVIASQCTQGESLCTSGSVCCGTAVPLRVAIALSLRFASLRAWKVSAVPMSAFSMVPLLGLLGVSDRADIHHVGAGVVLTITERTQTGWRPICSGMHIRVYQKNGPAMVAFFRDILILLSAIFIYRFFLTFAKTRRSRFTFTVTDFKQHS